MKGLRVAIDGPAGAGKSTIARRVAEALGLLYVDTGAMYRGITWVALQKGIDPADAAALANLARAVHVELRPEKDGVRVWIDGQDITPFLRDPGVSRAVPAVSGVPAVRMRMMELQKDLARRGGVVMDGRDIGTAIMPDAEVKVFLTASLEERAKRRVKELRGYGHRIDPDQVGRELAERDRADAAREFSPLVKAPDARVIDTTGRDVESVVEEVLTLCRTRLLKGEE
ncbi:(d)CMP kinase [Kyrpidia spormannii]|uniref:Cytidylate kinase n=2 Tax=Kyrpidia spormannii TaxID=2055160 RepID=A0ACA8Z8L6_9BACL|nr:(d)CMP kinase [Kyrpidia spormannii]CAB3391980.1 cytidylate kinase [Kyrpidia spormannii]CAB3392897.1 cytidylate kinase [Kyrpidia spormannii]